MARILTATLTIVLLFGAIAAAGWTAGSAQDTGPQATIQAQQTTIANLEATVKARGKKINAQRTQIAEYKTELSELRSQVPTATPVPAEPEIGQTVEVQGWKITATGTELWDSVGTTFSTNTAVGVYLVIYLSVENTSNSAVEFPVLDFRVTDSADRTFTPEWDPNWDFTYTVFGRGFSDVFQPGLEYPAAIVIDVPDTASGFTLTTSNKVMEIKLDR